METAKNANTTSLVPHLTNSLDNNEASWEPAIEMYPTQFTLQELIENKENFYAPQGLIQRYLEEWLEDRRNSYIYDLFSGASSKDLFILAALKPIIEKLKLELSVATDNGRIDTLNENLEYFEDLQNKGVKFLIIDGQHRLNEIHKFFQVESQRPYTAPTISKLSKIQKTLDHIKVANKDGILETFPLNKKSFNEFPKNLRTKLLSEIKIVVSMIESGDIHELKGLFGKANSGTSISFFVKLLSDSYGVSWRYMTELCDKEKQNSNILKLEDKFHGFAGQYAPTKMGLAYTFSEMLVYIASKYGRDRTLPLRQDMKDSLEVLYDFEFNGLDKKMRALHSKILKIIGNGMAHITKKSKGVGRAELADMVIMSCMLLDNTHPTRPTKSGPTYKINDPIRYIEAVMKMLVILKVEDLWMVDPDGNDVYRENAHGKIVRARNPDSYKEHQRAIWDDGNVRHREGMMWNRFVTEFLPTLEMQKVISMDGEAVKNQAQSRAELAVKTDFKDKYGSPLSIWDDVLGHNKSHDLGHIIAKDKGGDASVENLEYEPISANRSKGNA